MYANRHFIKQQVFTRLRMLGGFTVKCQLCGTENATDLHEIPNRAHVKVEYVPPSLCCALCRSCNGFKADSNPNRRILLERNMQVWGAEEVLQQLQILRSNPAIHRRRTDIIDVLLSLYEEIVNEQ